MQTAPHPMSGPATVTTGTTASSLAESRPGRLVVDVPTRVFHWLFALSFLGAYLSAESERWRALHVTLGYTLAGLLAFRVLYGLFGPRQVTLGQMWRKLASGPDWIRSVRQGRFSAINWRQGQNLAMALAIIALLLLALPLTLSGYASYAEWGDIIGGEWWAEIHEFFGDAVLMVVLAHLAIIAGLSLLRHQNLVRPMLTGRIDGKGPDLVRHQRGGLAGLLLVVVVCFWGWQWQQSPSGLFPTGNWTSGTGDRNPHHDDD